MKSFRELLERYPLLKLAVKADGERILEIINSTEMQTRSFQVSFDRSPDFFSFLPSQGTTAFVVLFMNRDDNGSEAAHGMGVLTVREFMVNGKRTKFVYSSDLRVLKSLNSAARLQWRVFLAVIIASVSEISDFDGASGVYTAMWDENLRAKRALLEPRSDQSFMYQKVVQYSSFSIWGTRPFSQNTPTRARKAVHGDIEKIKTKLLSGGSDTLCWLDVELERTLKSLGKSWLDFLVQEEDGEIVACGLPLREDHRRSTIVRSMPLHFRAIGRSLPFFGRPPLLPGQRMKTLSILFFRGEARHSVDFVRHLWSQARSLLFEERFHVIIISALRESGLEKELRRGGFFAAKIEGTLFAARAKSDGENADLRDYTNMEIGLL